MAATLFQACQNGKLAEVKEILEENKPDLEAKDAQGLTALIYAAQHGHVAIVQELLSRGARPEEAASQGFAKGNAEVASMLSSAVHSIPGAGEAPAYDIQGGQQMPDGSVSYVPNGVHPADPAAQHAMQQPYMYQPPPSFFDPTQMSDAPHRGHGHKDSSAANLPPPDVARLIPCKFFPNCRYGDKCLFAHPGLPPTNGAGAVSPGPGPVFYQPPPNYGYSPYGPPQHFYSMAPPMPIQYAHNGVPMPVHMPLPPHMGGPHVSEQQGHPGQGEGFNPAFHSQPSYYAPVQGLAGYADAESNQDAPVAAAGAVSQEAAPGQTEGAAEASSTQAAQDSDAAAAAAKESNPVDKGDAKPQTEGAEPAAPAADSSSKPPVHRRQSFNSFLHHHAIPFQPSQQLNGDVSLLQGVTQPPFTRGNKGPRRGGASLGGAFGRTEFGAGNKRADRPACYFFIRAVCKHGEECRFPHILPDGTDARGPNGGRPNGGSDAHRNANRSLAPKAGRSVPHANNVPATAPGAQVPSGPSKKANGVTPGEQPPSGQAAQAPPASTPPAVPSVEASIAKVDAKIKDAAANGKENNGQSHNEKTPSPASSKPAVQTSAAPTANGNGAKEAAAQAAGIPSKPSVAQNGGNAARPAGSQKPQANGAGNGVKGAQNAYGANGRPAFGRAANNGSHGRGGQQQGGQNATSSKKVAQRVPNSDDFPALPNAPAASGSPTPSAGSNGAQRANFSAILSAPAPVRKIPEPTTAAATESNGETDTGNAEPAKEAASPDASEDKQAQTSKPANNGSSAPDFATVAQQAVAV